MLGQNVNPNNLLRKEAKCMALGVGVVIPQVIAITLVRCASTGAKIHRGTGTDDLGSVVFRVEGKLDFVF